MKGGSLAAAAALLAAIALTACGERTLSASELVAELNDAGAGLVLGEPLPEAGAEGVEVFSVAFSAAAAPDAGDAHGAGAIVVMDDAEQAGEEFTRCEAAVDFTCFRAGNTVLRFTGITAAEEARITSAVSALAD